MRRRSSPVRSVRRNFIPWRMCASTWLVSPYRCRCGQRLGRLPAVLGGYIQVTGRNTVHEWDQLAQCFRLPGKPGVGIQLGCCWASRGSRHSVLSAQGQVQLSLNHTIPYVLAQPCLWLPLGLSCFLTFWPSQGFRHLPSATSPRGHTWTQ